MCRPVFLSLLRYVVLSEQENPVEAGGASVRRRAPQNQGERIVQQQEHIADRVIEHIAKPITDRNTVASVVCVADRNTKRLPAYAKPLRLRTAFMQRIQDRVRNGYVYWTAGAVPPEKWAELSQKFEALYYVSHNTKQRGRNKKKGIASAMLIAYFDSRENVTRFVLQVSAGTHAAHMMEKLQDATTKEGRITLESMGYELVRLDGRWTWRMTPDHVQSWQHRIRRAASHPAADQAAMLARQIIWSLSRVPGFRGAREDAFSLRGTLLKEWRRLRNKQDMKLLPPRPWPRIGYARRVKSK